MLRVCSLWLSVLAELAQSLLLIPVGSLSANSERFSPRYRFTTPPSPQQVLVDFQHHH